ncbi:MAG: hypothetical protein ACP5C4_06465 [Methanomicrobiales archaeon]
MGSTEKTRRYLREYVTRVAPLAGGIDDQTGHALASAALMFRLGVYRRSASWCDEVLDADLPGVVERAVRILRAWAQERGDTGVRLTSTYSFEGAREPDSVWTPEQSGEEAEFLPEDAEYLAVDLPETTQDIDWATLRRENALLLIYAVSLQASPDDAPALGEHENAMITILETYLEKMEE